MKKIIARILVLTMMLSAALIPSGGKSEAATKAPKITSNGIADIPMMSDYSIVQEKGKKLTITIKNVKKSNVKSLKVFPNNTNVVTVDKYILTSKKVGVRLNVKKVDTTVLSLRLVLKKAQGGKKLYSYTMGVTGVKKLSKKEIIKIRDDIDKANTLDALLEKHDNFKSECHYYDETGNVTEDVDVYNTKEDTYFIGNSKDGGYSAHTYFKSDLGYTFTKRTSGQDNQAYVIDYPKMYEQYYRNGTTSGQGDDESVKLSDFIGYYDGLNYFISFIQKSEEGETEKVEFCIDANSNEIIYIEDYVLNEKNSFYLYYSQKMIFDDDLPDLYYSLKYEFERKTEKMIKINMVFDPGTSDEKTKTYEVPSGSEVLFSSSIPGYTRYHDAAGTDPAEPHYSNTVKYEDVTYYYIKNKE